MSPGSVAGNPAAIGVQMSKLQASMIWPGLNYIICQWLTWDLTGNPLTSYAFRVLPRPPGYDSAKFSAAMMERIQRLAAKIQPIQKTGGKIAVDEFELRAAIFAARTSVNLERHKMRKLPKKDPVARQRADRAKQTLKRDAERKKRVVQYLEQELKRAGRAFKSALGPAEFRAQSKEWRGHLKWMEFHLTYFKPLPSPATGRLERRRVWGTILRQMAEQAIVENGYQLPDAAALDSVVSRYLDYSLRGRIGKYNHIFVSRYSNSPIARSALLEFIQKRLLLEEAT